MLHRVLSAAFAIACMLVMSYPVTADPPADSAEWLQWSPENVHDNTMSLASHEDQNVFVLLFAPDGEDACTMTCAIAAHVRAHPNHAGKVLAMCTGTTGHKAIRRYLRQEEYKKRVAAWEATQAAAEAAAQQAGQKYQRPSMPDYAKTIETELTTQQGRNALMDYHLPFKTCARCEPMWAWLCRRITAPITVPRLLKFDQDGAKLNEWSSLPTPNPIN